MSATAKQIANEAIRLLSLPEIPYVLGGSTINGMDCQGLVKYCAQRLGVKLNYSGSNDMYRNACSWLGTYEEAKAQKRIVPGAAAFIVEYDGQEGIKYAGDGLGNASHVGIITMQGEAYSIDASSSAGKVRSRNERDSIRTWTHIGWLKGINYEEEKGETASMPNLSKPNPIEQPTPSINATVPQTAIVTTLDGGALNLRSTPSEIGTNRIGRAPHGSVVEILETRSDWTRIRYEGMTAWAQTKYLTVYASNIPVVVPKDAVPVNQQVVTKGIKITIPEETARLLHTELDAALFG